MDDISSLSDDELRSLIGDDFNLDGMSEDDLRKIAGDDETIASFMFFSLFPGSEADFWRKFEHFRMVIGFRTNELSYTRNRNYFVFGVGEDTCYGKIDPIFDFPGICDVLVSGKKREWENGGRNAWNFLKHALGIMRNQNENVGSGINESSKKNLFLTDREMDVLKLYAKSFRQGEIARDLRLSRATVKDYREKILEKFRAAGYKIRGIQDAIELAFELGLL
jgi:hypothetical protein